MKLFVTFLIIFTIVFQGVTQTVNINDLDRNTRTSPNPKEKYALINDLQHIEIDKQKSAISFDFISEDTSGTITGLDFDIKFNPNDPNNASFSGTALVETIDTGNFIRDGHLMWKKFFYKKQYPKIIFKSSHVVDFENNTFKVVGILTIKGVAKEEILTFTLIDKELKGNATIHTSDYDVNIHDEREKNKLNIQFNFPLR